MNIRPALHIGLAVLLSLAAAFGAMLLGCAVAIRTEEPLALAAGIGIGAYLIGAFLTGFISARGGYFHPLTAALFGGAAYAAVVLITSLFVPGDTGISRHLLMLGGGLALSAGGGSLLLVRRPRTGKSNARRKFLRARK